MDSIDKSDNNQVTKNNPSPTLDNSDNSDNNHNKRFEIKKENSSSINKRRGMLVKCSKAIDIDNDIEIEQSNIPTFTLLSHPSPLDSNDKDLFVDFTQDDILNKKTINSFDCMSLEPTNTNSKISFDQKLVLSNHNDSNVTIRRERSSITQQNFKKAVTISDISPKISLTNEYDDKSKIENKNTLFANYSFDLNKQKQQQTITDKKKHKKLNLTSWMGRKVGK
jgi:hypothetical protein